MESRHITTHNENSATKEEYWHKTKYTAMLKFVGSLGHWNNRQNAYASLHHIIEMTDRVELCPP